MKTYEINAGTFYSDYAMTDHNFSVEAIGQVSLEDEEIMSIRSLIIAHHYETDIEALGLKEQYPVIYQKLEAAYRHAASLAEYKVDMLLGIYLDVFDVPDDIVAQCFAGQSNEAQEPTFDRFMAYLESLPLEEFAQFMALHLDQPFEDKPVGTYDVELPQTLIS